MNKPQSKEIKSIYIILLLIMINIATFWYFQHKTNEYQHDFNQAILRRLNHE